MNFDLINTISIVFDNKNRESLSILIIYLLGIYELLYCYISYYYMT